MNVTVAFANSFAYNELTNDIMTWLLKDARPVSEQPYVGHTLCSMLSIFNKLPLQNELQAFMTS